MIARLYSLITPLQCDNQPTLLLTYPEMNSGQLILSDDNMRFLRSIHGRPGKVAFPVEGSIEGDELTLSKGQHLFLAGRNWVKGYTYTSLKPGATIKYGMVPLTHVYDVNGKTNPPVMTVADWISKCKTKDPDEVRAEAAKEAAGREDEESVLKPKIRTLTDQLEAMVAENTKLKQKLSARPPDAAAAEAGERPDPAQELRHQLAELEAAYKKMADEQKAGSRVIRRLRMEQKREQRKQATKPY